MVTLNVDSAASASPEICITVPVILCQGSGQPGHRRLTVSPGWTKRTNCAGTSKTASGRLGEEAETGAEADTDEDEGADADSVGVAIDRKPATRAFSV